jgi:hypothetical protein
MNGKDLVPIVKEAEWTPGPVWTGSKNNFTIVFTSLGCREINLLTVEFEVLIAVSTKNSVFWNTTQCSVRCVVNNVSKKPAATITV